MASIYVADRENHADINVWIADKEHHADLKIFFVDKEHRAKWNVSSHKLIGQL